MVKLRLRRKGRKAHPIYDIVAMHGRARRDGAFIERLGWYNPHTRPNTISINHERAIYWLNNGAQPTEVLDLLLSYDGVYLRRHLQFKGKPAEEIEVTVDKHRANAKARYARRAKLRIQRKENKIKAEEQAKIDAEKAAAAAAEKAAAEKAAAEAAAAASASAE